MELSFLPLNIRQALSICNLEIIIELRLRTGFPIKVIMKNNSAFLTENGISNNCDKAIICTKQMIEYIILTVTDRSIYAHNHKIKHGYLIANNGIRIGLTGECVFDEKEIITIKNVSSLNIRIPHCIKDCSNKFFEKILDKNCVLNTLIISPPLFGKTTMLKDLAIKLNKINVGNILIVDERGEFVDVAGENIDKITYSTKSHAFEYGVRSMSPSVIITDELATVNDWLCVKNASLNGVSVIASCHARTINEVKNKDSYIKGVFSRFVVLSDSTVGDIGAVYDENHKLI